MFDAESMPGLALDWGVIAGIAFSGILMVGLLAWLTVKVYRKPLTTGAESMIGHEAEIEQWDGKKGRVRIQGEVWHAAADDMLDLKKGDTVFVSAIDDLTLKIRAVA